MSGYYVVVNKDNIVTPVHNLATGMYLVKEGGYVVDQYSGRILAQK